MKIGHMKLLIMLKMGGAKYVSILYKKIRERVEDVINNKQIKYDNFVMHNSLYKYKWIKKIY